MPVCRVASSRKAGESGLVATEHALFYEDAGQSHVFYRSMNRGWPYPRHTYGGEGSPEKHARQAEYGTALPAQFIPGEFLPRVWRGLEHPPSQEVGLHHAEVTTRRIARDLCRRLEASFWHVEPVQDCRNVFSHELRALLVLACTEVESSWKAVLEAHGYSGKALSTKDYIKLKVPLRLGEWAVVLQEHPQWGAITPFADWSDADGRTTASLPWYAAYNSTKHDRETRLCDATLRHAVDAVAAVHIMQVAQFGSPISIEDVLQVPMAKAPETFELLHAPSWPADEEYVGPISDFQVTLGYPAWTRKVLQF